MFLQIVQIHKVQHVVPVLAGGLRFQWLVVLVYHACRRRRYESSTKNFRFIPLRNGRNVFCQQKFREKHSLL